MFTNKCEFAPLLWPPDCTRRVAGLLGLQHTAVCHFTCPLAQEISHRQMVGHGCSRFTPAARAGCAGMDVGSNNDTLARARHARAHAPGPGLDQRVAGAACRCPGAAGYHRAGWLGRWAEGAELGPLRSAGWVDGRRVGGLEGRWVWCPQLFVCPRGRLDCPRGPAAEAA